MAQEKPILVVWISGNRIHRRQLLEKIRASMGEHEEIKYSEDNTVSELQAEATGGDCFGTKKLILVEGIPSSNKNRATVNNEIKKIMENVSPDCMLVFNGLDVSDYKALSSHAGKVGRLFSYDENINLSGGVSLIVEQLAAHDKKIETKDAELLWRYLPSKEVERQQLVNIDHLRITVDKIISYTDKKKNVTLEDILTITPNNSTASSWALYDALDDKKVDDVYAILPKLLMAEGDRFEGVRLTLAGLHWRFRLMVVLKESLTTVKAQTQQEAFQKAVDKTKQIIRVTQEGSGFEMKFKSEGQLYSDAMINRMIGQYGPSGLAKYTMKRLVNIVNVIEQAMESVRYIDSRSLPQYLLLLDMVILTICEEMDDTTRKSLHKYFTECNEV